MQPPPPYYPIRWDLRWALHRLSCRHKVRMGSILTCHSSFHIPHHSKGSSLTRDKVGDQEECSRVGEEDTRSFKGNSMLRRSPGPFNKGRTKLSRSKIRRL